MESVHGPIFVSRDGQAVSLAHMPGFGDSAFIILLALLLFGPKKLPVLARQLGKLMADFRRASNEFRTQMEEELRVSEQAERQKQIAAIEAAAPPSEVLGIPQIDTPPHTPPDPPTFASPDDSTAGIPPEFLASGTAAGPELSRVPEAIPEHSIAPEQIPMVDDGKSASSRPLPVATAGDLAMMPPATGLPVAYNPRSAAAPEPESLETAARDLGHPEIVHHG